MCERASLQSWLVDLRQPNEIVLYCDRSRILQETDPFGRQIMISQGTFLELLLIAARELGFGAELSLFPDGALDLPNGSQRPSDWLQNRASAKVVLRAPKFAHSASEQPRPSVDPDSLFTQILRRRTNREAYFAEIPPVAAIADIANQAKSRTAKVGFVSQGDTHFAMLSKLVKAAWRTELTTQRTLMESYQLLRIGPEEILRHRDGITVNQLLPRALVKAGMFDRRTAPAADDPSITSQIEALDAKVDATPMFFWLASQGNDRTTQINAGRAYMRAQLAATAWGLSMHPVSQALQEYHEQADSYREIHQLLRGTTPDFTLQMCVRLGFAPSIQPAPRRLLNSIILA